METKKTRKPGSGGPRPNSGRKRSEHGVKKNITVMMYPVQIEALKKKYGSLQKAVDTLEWKSSSTADENKTND